MLTLFSTDGSFGAASGMVVVDTRIWNEQDWDMIDNCLNDERVNVAIEIAKKYGDM